MKNFLLIGAAGYIAPKHMLAIKETRNNLLAALDKHDSVGVLDTYFPDTHFFTEFERFDRHAEKLKRQGVPIDYVVVCSPNYLHDAHIRFGLRIGADVICEKPTVINPWNVDALLEIEKDTGRKVFTILQLRLHPAIALLKEKIRNNKSGQKHIVELDYITTRGRWYHTSWKGDVHRSGGITTNIGLHFFDILLWLFGNVQQNIVERHDDTAASGKLILENAEVNWRLSIDRNDLPQELKITGKKIWRSLSVDGELFNLNEGFENLHTRSYEQILSGDGVSLSETRNVIQLVHDIRNHRNQ